MSDHLLSRNRAWNPSECPWIPFALPEKNERLGAVCLHEGRARFRVWAIGRTRVDVEIVQVVENVAQGGKREWDGGPYQVVQRVALTSDAHGYFVGEAAGVEAGDLYRFRLDEQCVRPDPASRAQPLGVHGPSQVIDPAQFKWSDSQWTGVAKRDLIIYELHVGTFTSAGTFRGVIERLPELLQLGITAIELLPVAQAPGRWNWGYDGVNLFAVSSAYGPPSDLAALVDACHAHGIAVLLDVVYNHVGPEGNYLSDFGPYFSQRHRTPWGDAFDFDGPSAEIAERFIVENALRWLDEYHIDGLRLDAIHFMQDDRPVSIVDRLRAAVSQYVAAHQRIIHLIGEANVYDDQLVKPSSVRAPYDAIWCDCLMHAIYSQAVPGLKLTHRDYQGAKDVATALEQGYLFAERQPVRASADDRQRWHGKEVSDLEPAPDSLDRRYLSSLVTALQTHDSVGNHPQGKRLHHLTSIEHQQAAVTLLLLYPTIPMLFMGEEWATAATFPFFADFLDQGLRDAVDRGRAHEYPHHEWAGALLPSDPRAFQQAICDSTAERHEEMFEWYRKLIELRKEGIADGWLSAENLTVECDEQQAVFRLRYSQGTNETIEVLVRLDGEDLAAGTQNVIELTLSDKCEWVLRSQPDVVFHSNRVGLPFNRSAVVRWCCTS